MKPNNVKPHLPNDENNLSQADTGGCSVCRDLLVSLGRFFEMLGAVRDSQRSDWLTVEDIAQELKLSKSIVYRLIRNGELEAVDLVAGDEGKTPQKGHFRIRRSASGAFGARSFTGSHSSFRPVR